MDTVRRPNASHGHRRSGPRPSGANPFAPGSHRDLNQTRAPHPRKWNKAQGPEPQQNRHPAETEVASRAQKTSAALVRRPVSTARSWRSACPDTRPDSEHRRPVPTGRACGDAPGRVFVERPGLREAAGARRSPRRTSASRCGGCAAPRRCRGWTGRPPRTWWPPTASASGHRHRARSRHCAHAPDGRCPHSRPERHERP